MEQNHLIDNLQAFDPYEMKTVKETSTRTTVEKYKYENVITKLHGYQII